MSQKRVFSKEFKDQAVRLALESGNVCATARNLDIGSTSLDRWVQAHRAAGSPPIPVEVGSNGKPTEVKYDEQLERERADNRRLSEELEILKKALGIVASRPRYDTRS